MNQQTSIETSTFSSAGSDAIARRAYELWENEGRPEGSDLWHWLQAESEVGTRNSTNGDRSNNIDTPRCNESAPRNTAPDTRPVSPVRAASSTTTAGRDGKSPTGAPFNREKNAAGGSANKGGAKRKPVAA